jgi:hypothetical protein
MAGKFVEAVTKALFVYGGQTIANPRKFSAGAELRKFENTLPATTPDAVRMVIPKACLFAYEIASNRGGRHDAHDVDANEMDARTLIPAISSVLAEMVRFCAARGDHCRSPPEKYLSMRMAPAGNSGGSDGRKPKLC